MSARLTRDERLARTVGCDDCHAKVGDKCVYTVGRFIGTPKLSGAHGSRILKAKDELLERERKP